MKKNIRIITNIFLALTPFIAWITMMFGTEGALSSNGLASLKYFTVLSNLLEGAASFVWLFTVFSCRGEENNHGNVTSIPMYSRLHRAEVFKFAAFISILMTFITVAAFLKPIVKLPGMYSGANFWFHLVIPVAAFLETILLVDEELSVKEAAMSLIPVLIYGCVYLVNYLINGPEADFYGFAKWGIPAGLMIFAGICLFVFGAALLFRWIMIKRRR